MREAHEKGIKTWVSCEPVLHAETIYGIIQNANHIDKFKIGKLNYHPSDIDWKAFGQKAERLCIEHGRNYYIKDALRKCMED